MLKNWENNGTEEIGLLITIPGPSPTKDKSHDILQISWH